jgi:hypothetical protein
MPAAVVAAPASVPEKTPAQQNPFYAFLNATDEAQHADLLTLRAVDRGVDVRDYLRRPGDLPYLPNNSESRDRWLNKQLGPILARLQQDRRLCVFCGLHYSNIDNIGRWQCRFHPGSVDGKGAFTCCGSAFNSMGCRLCDHSPMSDLRNARWHHDNVNFDLPQAVEHLIQPRPEAYVQPPANAINKRNPARSFFRVRRADL